MNALSRFESARRVYVRAMRKYAQKSGELASAVEHNVYGSSVIQMCKDNLTAAYNELLCAAGDFDAAGRECYIRGEPDGVCPHCGHEPRAD